MSNIASNCQCSASLSVDIVNHDRSKTWSNISDNSIGTLTSKRNGRPASNAAAAAGHQSPFTQKAPQAPIHQRIQLTGWLRCVFAGQRL